MQNNYPNQNLKIFLSAQNWLKNRKKVALATVISTWGSSPRPIGSQMIFNKNLEIEGSVSGGCIESEVIEKGLKVIEGGNPKVLKFGVSDQTAWKSGLTCGGKISVLIESFNNLNTHDGFEKFIGAMKERCEILIIKNLKNGDNFFQISQNWIQKKPAPYLLNKIQEIIKSKTSVLIDDNWFIHFFPPTPRLIIIGAVHIAQTLSRMANLCGFDVEIIDPRQAFITNARFPKQNLFMGWPDEKLKNFPPDEHTAVVTLSHDPKIDDEAIIHALNSKAFYIACLGSKKTHLSRLKRLKQKGFNANELNRLIGPAGLSINSKTPSEIAVSIMAQLIQMKKQ